MSAQLLLLLALTGPFCAFTRPSPTSIPDDQFTETHTFTPSRSPTESEREFPDWVTTEAGTEAPLQGTITEAAPEKAPRDTTAGTATEAASQQATTLAAQANPNPNPTLNPNPQQTIAGTPGSEKWQTASTRGPGTGADPRTAAPTEGPKVDRTSAAVATRTESGGDVVVKDEAHEGLTSGQVTGIIIGVLLLLIIAIVVMLAVARRMGKYSP